MTTATLDVCFSSHIVAVQETESRIYIRGVLTHLCLWLTTNHVRAFSYWFLPETTAALQSVFYFLCTPGSETFCSSCLSGNFTLPFKKSVKQNLSFSLATSFDAHVATCSQRLSKTSRTMGHRQLYGHHELLYHDFHLHNAVLLRLHHRISPTKFIFRCHNLLFSWNMSEAVFRNYTPPTRHCHFSRSMIAYVITWNLSDLPTLWEPDDLLESIGMRSVRAVWIWFPVLPGSCRECVLLDLKNALSFLISEPL